METHHRIITGNANQMTQLAKNSVDLVVTSPPYPMIQMWDDLFRSADPDISKLLDISDGDKAFERMHKTLDLVWKQVRRVTRPGGIVCVNIGDATRTMSGKFRLFGNHARIITAFLKLGFDQLPAIIWRKTTNAPNKFMGSGMYPPGAYVTLEHEYILIFRRGDMRQFLSAERKQNRRESAYFWEERNTWFSDVWFGLVGTRQGTNNGKVRDRSAAFPFELAYRLVNMFSVKGDMVLDPFLGSGTTTLAAMASARNSTGYEIDKNFREVIRERIAGLPNLTDKTLTERLNRHAQFVQDRIAQAKTIKHQSRHYGFPVITRQECDMRFDRVDRLKWHDDDTAVVSYRDLDVDSVPVPDAPIVDAPKEGKKPGKGPRQIKMF